MTKKVVITLIVLGILLLGLILLHVLSVFSSFTLGLKEEQYKVLVSDAIFLLAFVIALIPLFQVWQNTKKIQQELKEAKEQFQKEHGIQFFPIQREGEDDLDWMLPHYQRGQRVTIFAGSFDWLGDKPEMEKRILQLANEGKLYLVSYRSEQEIEDAFGAKQKEPLLRKLRGVLKDRFRVNSNLRDVACTFIQKSATADTEFLYKSRPDDEGHVFNACVISDTNRNRVLLRILSKLTEPMRWGEAFGSSGSTERG